MTKKGTCGLKTAEAFQATLQENSWGADLVQFHNEHDGGHQKPVYAVAGIIWILRLENMTFEVEVSEQRSEAITGHARRADDGQERIYTMRGNQRTDGGIAMLLEGDNAEEVALLGHIDAQSNIRGRYATVGDRRRGVFEATKK